MLTKNNETNKRLKHLFFVLGGVVLFLLIYVFLYLNFPTLTFRCAFHYITGLNCPGCGISRMLVSFVHLEFKKGINYNLFLGYTLPILLMGFIYYSYSYVTKKKIKTLEITFLIYLILLIIWGFIRNIIGI